MQNNLHFYGTLRGYQPKPIIRFFKHIEFRGKEGKITAKNEKILNGIAKIGSTQFTMGMEAACEWK